MHSYVHMKQKIRNNLESRLICSGRDRQLPQKVLICSLSHSTNVYCVTTLCPGLVTKGSEDESDSASVEHLQLIFMDQKQKKELA